MLELVASRARAVVPISRELLDHSGPVTSASLNERLAFLLSAPPRRAELRSRWLSLGLAPAGWWYNADDDWVEALGTR